MSSCLSIVYCRRSYIQYFYIVLFYCAASCVLNDDASNRAGLRSAQSLFIAVPRTHSTLGDRAFSVAAPRAWNNLPPHSRQYLLHGRLLKELVARTASQCRGYYIFYRCKTFYRFFLSFFLSFFYLSSFFFFRRLISDITERISTKLG